MRPHAVVSQVFFYLSGQRYSLKVWDSPHLSLLLSWFTQERWEKEVAAWPYSLAMIQRSPSFLELSIWALGVPAGPATPALTGVPDYIKGLPTSCPALCPFPGRPRHCRESSRAHHFATRELKSNQWLSEWLFIHEPSCPRFGSIPRVKVARTVLYLPPSTFFCKTRTRRNRDNISELFVDVLFIPSAILALRFTTHGMSGSHLFRGGKETA